MLVKKFLEEELKEDDLEKQVRTWNEFQKCSQADQDIEDFLSNFNRAYKKAIGASSDKALMSRVSTNNTIFTNGDKVWYKRE